jgi:hypothetical protein
MRALVLAVGLLGCAVAPPMIDAGPSDAGPLALSLGTGAHDFTPIAENDVLLLARGCQGLQHVWISLHATGIAPRGVHVRLSLTRASDGVMVSAELDTAITFSPDTDGYALSGLMLVIPMPDVALGAPLELRGDITDREGRSTTTMRDVTIAWGTEICGA